MGKRNAKTEKSKEADMKRRKTKKYREAARKYYKTERGKRILKLRGLKNKFNLTEEEYLKIFEDQEHKCGICATEVTPFASDSHVDHDHKTGKVRGILCCHCNSGLGWFKDSKESLMNAVLYLMNE